MDEGKKIAAINFSPFTQKGTTMLRKLIQLFVVLALSVMWNIPMPSPVQAQSAQVTLRARVEFGYINVGAEYSGLTKWTPFTLTVSLSRPMKWNGGVHDVCTYDYGVGGGLKPVDELTYRYLGATVPGCTNYTDITVIDDGKPVDVYVRFEYEGQVWEQTLHVGPKVGLSLSDETKGVGQTFALPVLGSNLTGMRGIEGKICYNDSVLRFERTERTGTLTEHFTFFESIENSCLSFAAIGNINFDGVPEAGTLFNVVFMGIGRSGDASPLVFTNLYFSPQREVAVTNGLVQLTGYTLSGQTVDKYFNPLSNVQFDLRGPGWGMSSAVDGNGVFEIPIPVSGRHELNFSKPAEPTDNLRIGIEDLNGVLECIVDDDCIVGEEHDLTNDHQVHVDDALCIADKWIGRPTDGCTFGWEFAQVIFENLLEDHTHMQIIGYFIGDVATPGATAAATSAPGIEFLDNTIVAGEVSQLRLRISGTNMYAAGVVLGLQGVQIVDVTSQQGVLWDGDRIVVFSEQPVDEMLVTLHVLAAEGSVISAKEFHSAQGIVPDAASIVLILGPGPTIPQRTLFLPAMSR